MYVWARVCPLHPCGITYVLCCGGVQTMALDSKSQVLMAQNGAIAPLVKLLQPGDPMVQASAAGALWNLAANEQNKFAIAQAGAIQPLVAMLYSDVREAQLSAAGALQNLCVNASNKKTVAAAGGIEALMMLLSDKDRHVKAKAAGALQSLAVDEDNQKKIKSLGAIPLITKLLSSRTPEVFAPVLTPVQGVCIVSRAAALSLCCSAACAPLVCMLAPCARLALSTRPSHAPIYPRAAAISPGRGVAQGHALRGSGFRLGRARMALGCRWIHFVRIQFVRVAGTPLYAGACMPASRSTP